MSSQSENGKLVRPKECSVCGEEFKSSNGRGVHLGTQHSDNEVTDVLIEELHRVSDIIGQTPTSSDIKEYTKYSATTYEKYFDSWNKALECADFSLNEEKPEDVNKATLLEELTEIKDHLGRVPTSHDMKEHGRYSVRTYQDYFDSWNAALREAEFPLHHEYLSEEDLLDEIRTLKDKLGRTPTSVEMNKNGKHHTSTYRERFGSWYNAVVESGLDPVRKKNGEGSSIDYNWNWENKRNEILDRDSEQCRCCNCSDLEKLHVHHIRPAREFGAHDSKIKTNYQKMNSESNLITLCISCHASFEGKWKDSSPKEFEQKAREELNL